MLRLFCREFLTLSFLGAISSDGDLPKLINLLDSAGDVLGEFPFPGDEFEFEGIYKLEI